MLLTNSLLLDSTFCTRIERLEIKQEKLENKQKAIKTEIKKNKSLILSKIGPTEMQEITTFLKLEINVLDWKPNQNTVSIIKPFIWNKKFNENKQYNEYKDHLAKLLHLSQTMK